VSSRTVETALGPIGARIQQVRGVLSRVKAAGAWRCAFTSI